MQGRIYCKIDSVLAFLFYILSGLTICLISCMWLRMNPLYNYMGLLRICILVTALAIACVKAIQKRSIHIARFFFVDLAFTAICLLSSVLSNPSSASVAVFNILLIAVSYLFLAYLLDGAELTRFYETYINVMSLIAAISVFLWIVAGILNIIGPTATVTYIWDGNRTAEEFFKIYYIPRIQMTDVLFIGIPKNCGIFAEGTMYGFLLLVAYLLHRNCLNRGGIKRILLIVAIVSTMSVSPVLGLLLNEAIYFVIQRKENPKIEIMRKISIPLFLIVFVAAFSIVMQEKFETGSYGVRLDHFMGCIRIFENTFPFGAGFGERDSLFSYLSYAQGFSIGLPYLFAQGGLGVLVLVIAKFSNILACSIAKKSVGGIAFFAVFLWISTLTNNILHPIFWMVLMLVFTSYKKVLCYSDPYKKQQTECI